MAQLSDDCFAFGGDLLRLDDALMRVEKAVACVADTESVDLSGAAERILAETVTAGIDVPPYANSAVDGYAVYFEDLNGDGETMLPVGGRAAAGHPLVRPARRGEAIRIFTGAPMPQGANGGPDTVMMQEDCVEEAGQVRIRPGIKRGANARDAGEDIAAGQQILKAGLRLRPQDVGLAASVGRRRLVVYKPLRAAVFSTGDEVREPGSALGPGALYDSNRYAVAAALRGTGCQITDLGILPDDFETIRTTLRRSAADYDVLVTTGGMSTGREDHVRTVMEQEGKISFWRLAIKPGRPVGLGTITGDGRTVPLIGLPGNPVAAMTTLLCLGAPIIARLSGAEWRAPRRYRVRSAFDYGKKAERREFVRGVLQTGEDGQTEVHKHGRSGAAILSSLSGADGFVELAEDVTILKAGESVDFLPFSELGL